jgi:glutathione synthase/RimK-type ligase-like ATP-grasp enzyme
MTIAIATCRDLPDGDEDAAALKQALGERGIPATWCVWNDPGVEWSPFDLVIIRSTWDYTSDLRGFLNWADTLDRVSNPANVLRWNTDKAYLRDLAVASIPIVPTIWAAPGAAVELPPAGEFVIKPSVGAGSKGAGRFEAGDPAALGHAEHLHAAGRTVMVQPYLAGVDTAGETALVYFGGQFSHAIGKAAMLPEAGANALDQAYSRSLYVDERISRRVPTDRELALGERVSRYVRDRVGTDLLYSRVDLLPTADGPVVIEVELVEPSLFLEFADGAVDRFADVIASWLVRLTA